MTDNFFVSFFYWFNGFPVYIIEKARFTFNNIYGEYKKPRRVNTLETSSTDDSLTTVVLYQLKLN